MAKQFEITNQEWTKLAPGTGEDSDLVLSTSVSRTVTHTVGKRGNPVCLKQLSADPAHPFTAGQMIVTLESASTLHGERDVAHSEDFEHALFYDENQDAPGVTEQGGLYLANYRVPLEWLIQVYTQTTGMVTKYFLQVDVVRPDRRDIDETDRTAASLTIDPDTEETVTDIVLANGTSTPSVEGGVEMKWELTEAQHTSLKPVDADGNRVHKKIGLTLAATSSVAPITFSAFEETHPDVDETEVFLDLESHVGVKAPSTGAWYARLRFGKDQGRAASALLQVGE